VTPIEALARLLAESAQEMGLHSYVVGGAPRDYLLGREVKDLDVVVERKDKKDALTLGSRIAQRLGLRQVQADKLGVVHIGPFPAGTTYEGVDLTGQKIEVVTARKEKYDRYRGTESHKPVSVEPATILEDLQRRDFTMNTLMWALADLEDGFENAPVLDYLEDGIASIKAKVIRTPLDPYETFDDDPTRMLRAIRFMAKYDFIIDPRAYDAIREQADSIRRLAYEAIDPLFFDKILTLEWDQVEKALAIMSHTGLLESVKKHIPAARQRRAIVERIPSFKKRLQLFWWGFATDIRFEGTQNQRFRDADVYMNETELNALYEKFRNPIDTAKYMELSGATGPAIGAAIARARDLVLLGISDDRIMQILVEGGTLGPNPEENRS